MFHSKSRMIPVLGNILDNNGVSRHQIWSSLQGCFSSSFQSFHHEIELTWRDGFPLESLESMDIGDRVQWFIFSLLIACKSWNQSGFNQVESIRLGEFLGQILIGLEDSRSSLVVSVCWFTRLIDGDCDQ